MSYEKKSYYKKQYAKKEQPSYKSKRGELSTLMSEEQKSNGNVQDLSYDFSCRIIRLYQYLSEDSEYKEYTLSKQVLRSGTSIGLCVKLNTHNPMPTSSVRCLLLTKKQMRHHTG